MGQYLKSTHWSPQFLFRLMASSSDGPAIPMLGVNSSPDTQTITSKKMKPQSLKQTRCPSSSCRGSAPPCLQSTGEMSLFSFPTAFVNVPPASIAIPLKHRPLPTPRIKNVKCFSLPITGAIVRLQEAASRRVCGRLERTSDDTALTLNMRRGVEQRHRCPAGRFQAARSVRHGWRGRARRAC